MNDNDFRFYKRKVLELYEKREFEASLTYAVEAHDKFGDELSDTFYWIACLQSLLGRTSEALQTLRSAVIQGIWWAPRLLQNESDFDNIREGEEFRGIEGQCAALWKTAQTKTKPQCLCYYPRDYDEKSPLGLFLIMHPYNDNASNIGQLWRDIIPRKGYLLAVPQSSQPISPNRFCWDDHELAKSEIKDHYRHLLTHHQITPERTIVAGWSQGAGIALKLILEENEMNTTRVFLIVPAIRKAADFLSLLNKPKAKRSRGYILIGDRDHFYPGVRDLHDEAQRLHLDFRLEVVSGLGHALPENFEKHLDRALEFLANP